MQITESMESEAAGKGTAVVRNWVKRGESRKGFFGSYREGQA
jgi:hypothetical protein